MQMKEEWKISQAWWFTVERQFTFSRNELRDVENCYIIYYEVKSECVFPYNIAYHNTTVLVFHIFNKITVKCISIITKTFSLYYATTS